LADFQRIQAGDVLRIRYLPEKPAVVRIDGNHFKRNFKLFGLCLYAAFVSLLGLMTFRLWRPSLTADQRRFLTSATLGLLAMLVVGYVGYFVEVAFECRGVPIPMNGGMTAVGIFGLGAALATFGVAHLGRGVQRLAAPPQ
jgi:hypothetical protein